MNLTDEKRCKRRTERVRRTLLEQRLADRLLNVEVEQALEDLSHEDFYSKKAEEVTTYGRIYSAVEEVTRRDTRACETC